MRLKLTLGLLLLMLFWPGLASAKSVGLTITPPVQELVFNGNSLPTQVVVYVTNDTATVQTFAVSAKDFGSLNDTGGVLFIDPNKKAPSGFAQFLAASNQQVSVAPGQTLPVTVALTNLTSITPGGHYGAILLQQLNPPSAGIGASAVLSSLILAHKIGGEIYQLDLTLVNLPNRLWTSLPTDLTLKFQNRGNIHVIPRGVAEITNARGQVVARGIINQESAIVLPASQRDLAVNLKTQIKTNLPGRYRLKVDYRWDGSSDLHHFSQSFDYFPIRTTIIGLIVAVGLLIFASVIIVKMLRRKH